MSLRPFDKCPICGGDVGEKTVEKIVRGGNHTAVLNVAGRIRQALRPCRPCVQAEAYGYLWLRR